MRIIPVCNYDEMSFCAANIISAQIILKPDCVLGLATGSSPVGVYNRLIKNSRDGIVDFNRVKTVNLDEYKGLDSKNPQSYSFFMHDKLFDHVNINPDNINIPCGINPDDEAECKRYDEVIKSLGRIDLQLLGLGPNGHIGFNEPDEHFIRRTHKVCLTKATINANKRFFARAEDVPRFAYTMGIGDIMQAERIVMIISGESKADIAKKAFLGPITPKIPASILQLHKDFTLVADKAALSEM